MELTSIRHTESINQDSWASLILMNGTALPVVKSVCWLSCASWDKIMQQSGARRLRDAIVFGFQLWVSAPFRNPFRNPFNLCHCFCLAYDAITQSNGLSAIDNIIWACSNMKSPFQVDQEDIYVCRFTLWPMKAFCPCNLTSGIQNFQDLDRQGQRSSTCLLCYSFILQL